jgi:hypothetical protein
MHQISTGHHATFPPDVPIVTTGPRKSETRKYLRGLRPSALARPR